MCSENGGLQTGLEQGKEKDNEMYRYPSEGPSRYLHFRAPNQGEAPQDVQVRWEPGNS